eukprot:SAG31_NODE_116_length_24094_cov_38.884184_10_plen_226_part_00
MALTLTSSSLPLVGVQAMADDTVGIIYPPSDIRAIVDKTAEFVARNGEQFEAKILGNESDNAKFSFLRDNDPYNAYYRFKIKDIREGPKPDEGAGSSAAAASDAPAAIENAPAGSTATAHTSHSDTVGQVQSKAKKSALAHARELKPIPKREPPPDAYTVKLPTPISSQELDIVKLTAQSVRLARSTLPSSCCVPLECEDHNALCRVFIVGGAKWSHLPPTTNAA